MISSATLNELQDGELRTVIEQSEDLLKRRDEERKAKELEDARSILAAVGLNLKDLNGRGKAKAGKGPTYHAGHTYQHPTNKALTWNGKGNHHQDRPHPADTAATNLKSTLQSGY